MVLQCAKLSDYVRPFCGKSGGRANTGDESKVVASGIDQIGGPNFERVATAAAALTGINVDFLAGKGKSAKTFRYGELNAYLV